VILGVFRKNPPKENTPMALDDSALPELLAAPSDNAVGKGLFVPEPDAVWTVTP